MALKDILTQNDLAALNAALSQLAANLKIHVNETLSVAHGMNAIVAQYRDSADDQWGNIVMVFDFGTPPNVVRLYAPAQITALGPASTGSGLVATGATSGSFSSPGVPLANKPIVTVVTEDALDQASIYENMLLAHAAAVHSDTGANQCHGGRTYTELAVVDSLGHTVGRRYITLGINGTAWRIPCDEFVLSGVYGPPQPPRITPFSPASYRFNSSGPNGALSGKPFTVTWVGTRPGTIKWEVSHDGNTWINISQSPYNAPTYSTGGTYLSLTGWSPGIKYTLATVSDTQDKLTITQMKPAENTWRQLFIRASVTNSTGTGTSNTVQVDIYDETGSWIVYAAHAVAPFSDAEMRRLYRLRVWTRKNRPLEAAFYLGAPGNKLVARMREADFDFSSLTPEIRKFLADGIQNEQRFALFKSMVVRCLNEYWPDCPEQVAQESMADLVGSNA